MNKWLSEIKKLKHLRPIIGNYEVGSYVYFKYADTCNTPKHKQRPLYDKPFTIAEDTKNGL